MRDLGFALLHTSPFNLHLVSPFLLCMTAPSSPSSSSSSSSSSPAFPVPSEHAYLLILRLTDSLLTRVYSGRALLDQELLQLHALYGSTLEKALGIVDAEGVTVVRAEESGRFVFQVEGSEVRPYTCTLHHCSCPAYTNSVLLRPDSVYCKHQLASRLAHALGKVRERAVSDAEFNRLVMQDKYRPTHDTTSSSGPHTAAHVWVNRV